MVWIGVAGVLLIALSEWFPEREAASDATAVVTEQQVEQALEQRIAALLSSVEGVGDCRVMVTLESGAQTVYAAHTRVSLNGENYAEDATVLQVDTDAGPVGLKLTEIQPVVKGVAVVCVGGDDPAVRQRVLDVVTTAFRISERRVCVVKQN